MKTKNIFSLSALSTVMLAGVVTITGCNRNEEPPFVVSDVKAEFVTSIEKGAVTPKASGVRDDQFNSGDKIGIYAVAYLKPNIEGRLEVDGNYADNVISTYSGTAWTNSPNIYYPSVALNFYAFAPYNSSFKPTIDPKKYKFTVSLDQSEASKIFACDFMTALTENVQNTSTPTTAATPVDMKFYHRLAKVNVKFTFPTTYYGKTVKKVKHVILHGFKTVAEIDLTTKYTFQVDGTATGGTYPKPAVVDVASPVGSIQPNLASGNHENPGTELLYEAIVVPQTQPKEYGFIEIVLEYTDATTESFFYKEPSAAVNFVAARTSLINLTFQADNEIVLGDVTIKGWDTSLPPSGGNLTEKEVFNTFNCTILAAPAFKITKAAMTITQGTGAGTSTVYTVNVNHTLSQPNFSFSFDGTAPSPEYYPFSITDIKLIGGAAGQEVDWHLSTPKELTVTGDVSITQ